MGTEAGRHGLHLSFDVTRTRVVLRASNAFQVEFGRVIAGFPIAGARTPLSAEVALDDFLQHIAALAPWGDAPIEWDDTLAGLVQGVLDDAEIAARRLAEDKGPTTPAEVHSRDVVGLLGTNWIAPLTPFQLRDIASLLSLQHGANFSVPGAGKTRVALAVVSAMREREAVQRVLVVGPKSAYEAWISENEECFKEPLRASVMQGSPDASAELLVVNYERLAKALNPIAGWMNAAPSMIILDEAHRMKLGARGAYGAACLALGPLARRRLILTGTPAPNGAQDLENLLSFVWPGRGKRVVADAVGGGDLAHASRMLRPLFTRTTKSELGLPPVDTRIRYVDLPPLHRELYEALKGQPSARGGDLAALGRAVIRMLMAATSPSLLAEGSTPYEPLAYQVPPLEVSSDDSLHALLDALPTHELSPKYEEAVRIVADNTRQGRKTLVWSTFVRSITTLERLLAPHAPAVVHGGTSDRDEQLRRFREDADCKVLISNPATLGEGISLHHVCHDAIYVDRDFMAGRFLQSLDRIHRLGLAPDAETRVTVLAARNTIDEVVARRLEQKLDFMGQVLDDQAVQQLGDLQEEESLSSLGMDAEDIESLLAHLRGVHPGG